MLLARADGDRVMRFLLGASVRLGTKRRIQPVPPGLLIGVKRTAMLRRGNQGF
jgi:hypothetical protein